MVGTFGYMAPEQFQGRALPASDVYAAGVTALAALTGKQPEDLPHRGLRIDVPAGQSDVRPAVSEGFERALDAMVEPDPDARPARITPLLDLEPPRPAPTGTRSRSERPRRRRGRRARPRSPIAPYIGLLWIAWGLLWTVHVSWTVMMLAMLPIFALSQWSREWSRRKQEEAETEEQMRARVEVDPSDARVRVQPPRERGQDEGDDEAESEREPEQRRARG
ncbi:MAG TPA: hypothetical protein VF765_17255 [Polyangiaceae bacterium]